MLGNSLHTDISENKIGINGAISLAEALAYNRSISTLGKLLTIVMRNSEIGREGIEHIANAIKVNTTLSKLGEHMIQTSVSTI